MSLLRAHWQKLIALALWSLIIGSYLVYTGQNNIGPADAVSALVRVMRETAIGPLIFFGLYLLRPLLFFSASLLTVASGYLFGPMAGILYTIIASNASSLLAYAIGRFFGSGLLQGGAGHGLLQRYAERMRNNSFETVLLARLVFLPYDLVSYVAGFLRINWRAFIAATALGAIPGTVSLALLGASIQGDFSIGALRFDPLVFAISAIIFVASLILSRVLRKRA